MSDQLNPSLRVKQALEIRFGNPVKVDPATPGLEELAHIAEHRSFRKFDANRPVSAALLDLIFACAMSAPSKSDLQQADIVHVEDRTKVQTIADMIPDMPWIARAPVFLVFCGNNRRIRQIGDWRGKAFANDHLDHFMNAAVDAGIIMTNFIRAAEAVGMGCCPISAVRNRSQEVSDLLGLPDWVFPLAGLCAGFPGEKRDITPRLPLDVTIHRNTFDESRVRERIDAYDRRRNDLQPFRRQRDTEKHGEAPFYGWSEDKARQYCVPEREHFGQFIRGKRFRLV